VRAPLAGVSVVGGVSTAIEGKNQVFGDYTSQEGKKKSLILITLIESKSLAS
jgi:hypothetical protein